MTTDTATFVHFLPAEGGQQDFKLCSVTFFSLFSKMFVNETGHQHNNNLGIHFRGDLC